MKTHKNIYKKIISFDNLLLAWRRARKGKTTKQDIKEFEENTIKNLLKLHEELTTQTYQPLPLKTFILRDPKTRKISKSDFRDRVIHHAIVRILEPIFEKSFIYDNCAGRKGKGTLFAIKRFEKFQRKITKNLSSRAYCLKADIRHYFHEVNHEILLSIMGKVIKCGKTIKLIKKILYNKSLKKGMPLGNLTSQFFANIYLNELDQFVKHKLQAKYYIRYVDDFVIFYPSKDQLKFWKTNIDNFLNTTLEIELHTEKSKIVFLSKGVDFVGFRHFYYFRLLRKRNIKNMQRKLNLFNRGEISYETFLEIFQGWSAYASWANTFDLRKNFLSQKIQTFLNHPNE